MSIRSEVFKMLDANVESVDIMQKLGVDAQTIAGYKWQWKKERGIKSNPPKTADELVERVLGDFDKKNETKHTEKKTYVAPGIVNPEKSTLKLISETKNYKGKYGEYTITDGVLTITLNDNSNSLEKPNLEELILELNQLGGMM